MEKKYQVFVSSTYLDLIEERRQVMQTLLELDCIPVGMELFPAADDDQWTLIKRLIDDCDYYIVIVGGRYGSINENGVSYTRMEYEYALTKKIPIIGFVHGDSGSITPSKSETDTILKAKLDDFKSFVQKKMVKQWTNPDDLGSQVSKSLVKLIKEKPRDGWVKASYLPSEDTMNEILDLRKQIDILQGELDKTNSKPSTDPILFYQNRSELPPLESQLENTDELWLQFFSGSVTNATPLHKYFFDRKKVKLLLPHPKHDSYADMCKLFNQELDRMQQDIRHLIELLFRQFPKVEIRWYEGILPSSLMIGNPESKTNVWVRYEILVPFSTAADRPTFRINNKNGSTLTHETVKSFKTMWEKSSPAIL